MDCNNNIFNYLYFCFSLGNYFKNVDLGCDINVINNIFFNHYI